MVSIVKKEPGAISLRALEQFCTKIAVQRNLHVKDPLTGQLRLVTSIHTNSLSVHKKKGFDSFRRVGKNGERAVTLNLHGTELETTTGQLTFFKTLYLKQILQLAILS